MTPGMRRERDKSMNNTTSIKKKVYCPNCNKEFDVVKVINEQHLTNPVMTYILTCGHRAIHLGVLDIVNPKDEMLGEHRQKRDPNDPSGRTKPQLLQKIHIKTGGKSKQPAIKIITIDREHKKKIDLVKEQNKNGVWEEVHGHEDPLKRKTNNRD